MVHYKVEYLSTSPTTGGKWYETKNPIDGMRLANELEALLDEYWEKGFTFRDSMPLVSQHGETTRTDGLVVILEKREHE